MAEHHAFPRPIRTVAVIGSGPSGTPAARQLQEAGLQVRVFERQDKPGGIWNWKTDSVLPLSVPTPPPSRGAFTPVIREGGVYDDPGKKERTLFSPPNPCYWNLSNNVPTTTMAFKDFPYPPGTEPNVSHTLISTYVHDYALHFGLDKLTSYNTRVELAEKVGDIWRLTLRRVVDEGEDKAREEYWTEATTGHYNAPYIPAIPGVDEWSATWPDKIIHSQGYRTPAAYKDKTVLIVGIGTSGNDISKDLSPHTSKLYLVGRNVLRGPKAYREQRKMQRQFVLPNAEQVPEIKRFLPPPAGKGIEEAEIELTDGRIITGVDGIIFTTGFQYSFPFLPSYHHDHTLTSPSPSASQSQVTPIITDGDGVLNLYRDVFYIPDPSLTFLGLSINTSAFSFFEYQSISIARVFAGTARLPSESARWQAYKEVLKTKGSGRYSHLMNKDGERAYVQSTVAWLNADAPLFHAPPISGHSPEWIAESDKIPQLIAKKYGMTLEELGALKAQPGVVPEEEYVPPALLEERALLAAGGAGAGAGAGGKEGREYKTAKEETNARASEGIARRSAAAGVVASA
ncbi:hypothetical protein B9479_005550 [Cryptococcus floricola]|uniref:FAD/NAD(P)-binding domain-containing protein n=1 Tax=Cryptococcus floricola TaxID=2591691 RepID=A0A5D3AUP1_9TREE|nr:hypothetical protein B9479_005550 [Cryptococcus floricola]